MPPFKELVKFIALIAFCVVVGYLTSPPKKYTAERRTLNDQIRSVDREITELKNQKRPEPMWHVEHQFPFNRSDPIPSEHQAEARELEAQWSDIDSRMQSKEAAKQSLIDQYNSLPDHKTYSPIGPITE